MDDTSNSQMDRPSKPADVTDVTVATVATVAADATDAATSKLLPEDLDAVSSPDPPSTRPNPFDDTDLLARKRRRTSGSASPPPSASTDENAHSTHKTTLNSNIDASRTGADDADLDQQHQRQDEAVTAAHVAESLHTPRTPTHCAPNNSTPISSSRVTINLRNSNGLAVAVSEPSSPTAMRLAHDINTDSRQHTGEEMVYTGSAQQSQMDVVTSPKSRLDSTSPPVELITISDLESEESDDEMIFSVDDKATGIISHDMASFNPILQFPYSEPDDDPSAPLHRLLEYLSTRTCASCFLHCRSRSLAIRNHPANMNKNHLLIARSSPKYTRGSKTTLDLQGQPSNQLCETPERLINSFGWRFRMLFSNYLQEGMTAYWFMSMSSSFASIIKAKAAGQIH